MTEMEVRYNGGESCRPHFGAGAWRCPVVILEIPFDSLNKRLLYPDEDWVSEEWNSDFHDFPLKVKMEFMRLHKHEWRDSLSNFSTVAYRGIVKGMWVWNPNPLRSRSCAEFCESVREQFLHRDAQLKARFSASKASVPETLVAGATSAIGTPMLTENITS